MFFVISFRGQVESEPLLYTYVGMRLRLSNVMTNEEQKLALTVVCPLVYYAA